MKHLLILVIMLAFLPACTKKIYVPAESSHTELRTDSAASSHTVLKVDSVFFRDSVSIITRGDTVFQEVTRWRERLRIRNDTVFRDRDRYIVIKDSINRPMPYPVDKKIYIERQLSAWQKFRLHSFWVLAVALAASMTYIFRKPLFRLLCRLRL